MTKLQKRWAVIHTATGNEVFRVYRWYTQASFVALWLTWRWRKELPTGRFRVKKLFIGGVL